MVAPSSFYRMQSGSMALLAIAVLLMICSGFTIGLTFAPCHSSICVERWFPSQARFHIAVFYGGIGIAATFLAAWSRSKATRSVSDYYLTKVLLPLVGLYLSVGGTLLSAWILAFTMASTTYWFPAEHVFWHAKGIEAEWTQFMFRVTWAGVTGHYCDILSGLVFLPVGRNSLISNAFGVQASALLLAHKLLAYTLCAISLIHGLLYYVCTMNPTCRLYFTNCVTLVFPCRLRRQRFYRSRT
jgi:ferric-chelate reductase